jgi:hypothetical protein
LTSFKYSGTILISESYIQEIRCARHAARTGGMRKNEKFQTENLNEREHLKDLGVDVRTILKCMLKKQVMMASNRFIWFRIESNAGHL